MLLNFNLEIFKRNWKNSFPIFFISIFSFFIFYTHAQYIFAHFATSGYILDSGWFAYLFESENFFLQNPPAINGLSFYSHHFSPYLFFFSFPLHHFLKLTGIEIFAIHQGLFFLLFFIGVLGLIYSAQFVSVSTWISGIFLGVFSCFLLWGASFPHYEISILAISTLAFAAYALNQNFFFNVLLMLLVFLREDGGFYGAVICLMIAMIEKKAFLKDKLYFLALVFVTLSLITVWIKSYFFPGFDAFGSNFSGHHWDHVTFDLLIKRLFHLFTSHMMVFILGSIVLSLYFKEFRFMLGLILLAPLFILHLLSPRDLLGNFSLYYGMPWLLIGVSWFYVYRQKLLEESIEPSKAGVIFFLLLFPLAVSSGIYDFYGLLIKEPNYAQSNQKILLMQKMAVEKLKEEHKLEKLGCFSIGISALILGYLKQEEILSLESNMQNCHRLFLFKDDLHYSVLVAKARQEGFIMNSHFDKLQIFKRM